MEKTITYKERSFFLIKRGRDRAQKDQEIVLGTIPSMRRKIEELIKWAFEKNKLLNDYY